MGQRASVPQTAASSRSLAQQVSCAVETSPAEPGGPREAGGLQGYAAIRAAHEQQTQIEQQRAQARIDGYQPLRFYLPSPDKPGIMREELQADIVILDHEPSFAVWEHSFPNPQTGDMARAPTPSSACRTTATARPATSTSAIRYYALFLTVMDMRPYVDKNGVQHNHSKKLLVVKNKNMDYFFSAVRASRHPSRHAASDGPLDKNGANHGNPEFVELHPEGLILETFSIRCHVQDGQRVVKEENEIASLRLRAPLPEARL